jgi:ABC-2 type transport system ATP-binding protein
MRAADDIIRVEDLRHAYRKGRSLKPSLNGLSFNVRRGEIFGLLGPNGAGKTTAVRILTTILHPSGGRAFVAGHNVVADALAVRKSIAVVLQENAVDTLLSTWDNLFTYGYLQGLSRSETRRRAQRVVEALGLEEQLSQKAQALSGGFKRRLQVAKALMVDSPILFLDEATTGMDPLIKHRVIDLIRKQAAAGRTVLLTTQLLDEAESLCDRMALMDAGRAIAEGRLSELRALSRKMFRIQLSFADADGDVAKALQELGPHSVEEKEGEYVMVVEGSEDEWIRKMARLSERWPLSHLEIRGANLEQIFLELYGGKQGSSEAKAPAAGGDS